MRGTGKPAIGRQLRDPREANWFQKEVGELPASPAVTMTVPYTLLHSAVDAGELLRSLLYRSLIPCIAPHHFLPMPSPHKKISIAWLRVLGGVGIALSLLLSAAMIWYLAAVEVPATNLLQNEAQSQDNVVSILIRGGASSTPMHATLH